MTTPHRDGYRPEIDGLRALAVLPVILYHLSETLVPAGFLGVDVFFVISGYLITGLLAADLREGRFSLWRFYERRARRILPALFVVIAACVLPASLLMLPGQHADFGLGILAAVGFVANFYYYQSTGYFMPSADTLPLLHTWSLSVEEQFYLFFPVILYAVWRFGRRSAWMAVALMGLASIVFSVWLSRTDPAANFYLLPARAWEMMAGALVALWIRPGRVLAEIMAAAGVAIILLAYFLPQGGSPLPGVHGVLPVVGTALVLWAGGASRVGWLLSLAPLKWIGLISYSAYLWHWPIIAFWSLAGGGELTALAGALILAATLALAGLTYLFVEKPFRNMGPAALFPTRALGPFLGVCAVALLLFGLLPIAPSALGLANNGDDAASIEARLDINYGLGIACEGSFTLDPACRTSERPEVLLWGDSYAMHLAPAIRAAGDWGGMIQMTKSTCAPVLGLSMMPAEYSEDWAIGCLRFNDEVFAWLAGSNSVRIVVLSSNLNILFHSLTRRDGSRVPEDEAIEAVRISLLDTVGRIRALGKQVVIVSPTPATGEDIGQCLAATERAGRPADACDFPLSDIGRTNRRSLEFLRELSDRISLIDLSALICSRDGMCSTRKGALFIYRDPGHLSVEGAEWLGRTYRFDRMIRVNTVSAATEIN